jgi:hypothetical protein
VEGVEGGFLGLGRRQLASGLVAMALLTVLSSSGARAGTVLAGVACLTCQPTCTAVGSEESGSATESFSSGPFAVSITART